MIFGLCIVSLVLLFLSVLGTSIFIWSVLLAVGFGRDNQGEYREKRIDENADNETSEEYGNENSAISDEQDEEDEGEE